MALTIALSAGVAQGLLHYHFGQKEGLYAAVIARRSAAINTARLRALDAVDPADPDALERVLDALVRPPLGPEGGGAAYARIFAAITGISIASAAVFTKIAVPQMIGHGYAPRFAVGVVAGSSVLGMLIPPSLLLILYGVITESSIGDLFLAGIGPGLLMALCFGVGVVAAAHFAPHRVQPAGRGGAEPLSARELAVKGLPIVGLIGFVLGGIYGGLFTPVEAGAMGALGAFAIGIAKRTLTLHGLWRVLV